MDIDFDFIFGGSGESRRYILYQDKSSFCLGGKNRLRLHLCLHLHCASEARRARFSFHSHPHIHMPRVGSKGGGAVPRALPGPTMMGMGFGGYFESEEAGYH